MSLFCREGLFQLCVIFCREMGYTWDRVVASRPLLGHPRCTWGHLWPLRWGGSKIFFSWFLKIVSNLWLSTVLCPLSGRVVSICGLEPVREVQCTHNLYPQIYISFLCLRCFPISLFCVTSKELLNTIKIITILSSFSAYILGKLPELMYSTAPYSLQDYSLFVLAYVNIIADPLLHPERNESSKVPCQSGTEQIWGNSWKKAKMNVVVDCFSKGLAECPSWKGLAGM